MALTPLLTKEAILSRVSPLDIFEAFSEQKITLERPISSPLRRDNDPSFVVFKNKGYYSFYDFGTSQRGDVFEFVSLVINNNSYRDVLIAIDSKLKLGIKEGKPVEVNIKRVEYEDDVQEEKIIQIQAKRFSSLDLEYWKQYEITHEDLKSSPSVVVYSIEKYWLNKELRFINYGELCFAYHFTDIDKFKIYRPYSETNKWVSNVPLSHMYGLENVKKDCEEVIVAKSVKDYLTLKKIHPCVCGTQNESITALSDENIQLLKNNAKKVYIAFDSDEAGKKASLAVTEKHNLHYLNTPNFLLKHGVKDWSDWVKYQELDAVKYFLNLKLKQ